MERPRSLSDNILLGERFVEKISF